MKINTSLRWKTPTRLQIKTPTQQQIIALSQVMMRAESTKKRPLRVKHFEKEINNSDQQQKLIQIPNVKESQSSEILTLRNNSITSMKGLNEYKNLNYIDLSANLIKEIEEINHLNLKVLIISHNKIKEIKNLPNTLKILDAKANYLEKVQVQNLTNLKLLNLQQNYLNQINLTGLKNLQKLYLDDNKFTHFLDIPFLEKLTILSLSQNLLIKFIDQTHLQYIPNIQNINIQGNPMSRFVLNENYLDNFLDSQNYDNLSRLRCKSVENQKNILDVSEELIIKEARLNVFDMCEQTPLPQVQQGKTFSFNKQLISKILKKQQETPIYRTEISQQGKRENKPNNQFIVKQAQINIIPDFSFIKKINKKNKQDIFKDNEIIQIKLIKQAFYQGKVIENYVSKYFILSKCLLIYGNPANVEQLDVDSLIIKYFDIEMIKNCNLFNFNKLTKITLSHNNINYLNQILSLKVFFPSIENLTIEKNKVSQCSFLKQFINFIFQFDERDRKQFSKYQDLKSRVVEDIDIEDELIPKIVFNQFDLQFNLYIQSLIDALNTQ